MDALQLIVGVYVLLFGTIIVINLWNSIDSETK